MKRNSFLYAIAGIAVWGLASCSSSDNMHPEQTDGRVPVELTNNIIGAVTRAATTLNESALTTGDITVRTSEAYATAYTYTAGAEGAMTSTAPAYYPAGGASIDIVAYSPANANDGTSETFTVSADQSSDDAYIASDLLWAKAENKNSASGAVNIAFAHKMAKIIVNVTAGNGISTIQSITLKNIKRQCTFDYASGAVSDVAEVSGATDVAVTTGGTTASSMGAACIPAQDLIGDFIEITTDKGTATYRLSSAKPVSAGNYYTINLTLNLAAVGTTNTIEAWSDYGSVNILPTGGDWTVSVCGTYIYTGSAIVPDAGNITVKTATDEDIAAGNYDVFVNNNTNPGEATLIVSGIGVYAGKVASCTYTIGKAAGSISYATTDVHKAVGNVFTNALTTVGDGTATYSSSNPGVATVDSSTGEVTVVAVGTTTITATAADGANYAYASPTTTYTLMVTNLTTLTALKALVNEGTDCSTYLGYEVNSNGDIAEKNVSGTLIGYISYISTSNVDKDISGSRILVIASEDAKSCDWGDSDYASGVYGSDMCGYSNTNKLIGRIRNGERQIKSAVAAWEYSAAIPAGGATPAHWFLPSKAQFDAMISACGSIEQLWEKLHLVNTEYSIYWSSTFDNFIFCIQYSQFGYHTSWYEKSTNRVGRVRACFAY